GDEDHDPDLYDPDLYEQLWQIDQLMTKAGVGYGKKGKAKYYLKEKKSGGGRSYGKAGGMSADLGTLKAGDFAPSVRQYQTIDQKTGSVPTIRKIRPNIRHEIKVSR